MFVVNLHDRRIDVHYLRTGQWEKRFGSDPGDDTVIHEPWNAAIGPHAENQLEMRAQDLKLPPRSTAPQQGTSFAIRPYASVREARLRQS